MEITLQHISKRYKQEWIFKKVSYQFEHGHSYAILGSNGAGKSTLLRLLSGHLSPTKGKIQFIHQKQVVHNDLIYKWVSYAAPYVDLIEELSLTEAILFHQKFKPFLDNLNADALIDLLNLKKSKDKQIRFFSSGMKQRLKLALAVCSDTPLLLLDEPTTNLDTQGMAWYQELIDTYTQNRLVIVASNVEIDYAFCAKQLNILDYK